jgi:hypothetical protein
MSRRFAPILLAIAAAISFSSALAGDNKLESIGAYADPGASDAVKKSLEAKGWRAILSDGPYCDIWLRASVPVGKTEAPGAVYTSIGESALIGVITFSKGVTDFRGQSVKPGSYTLRYVLHPTDGNHMGISPIRDFLVMVPVAMDTNPDAQFKFEELTKMSSKTTGTSHPGVLSLVQLAGAPAAPKLETNESNHIVFSAAIRSQSGSLPLAFILKGHAEQ